MAPEGGRWRRLSPAGVGALTVLELIHPEGSWPDWLRREDSSPRPWPGPGRLAVARLVVAGQTLDEVLVCRAAAGRCEVHLHGGPAVLATVVAALEGAGWTTDESGSGAAPASLRAAVALASTRWGALAERRRAAAEDRPDPHPLAASIDLARHAERLRRPAVVRLVGRPNAGKSTLFNCLLREGRALVSPRAGTTRDRLWGQVALHGVPIRLEDSAGLETGAAPAGAGVDLWVQVLSEPGEPRVDRAPLLAIGGKADTRAWSGLLAVSGRTGAGVETLRGAIATALGIAADPRVDTWTPLGAREGASGPG